MVSLPNFINIFLVQSWQTAKDKQSWMWHQSEAQTSEAYDPSVEEDLLEINMESERSSICVNSVQSNKMNRLGAKAKISAETGLSPEK